MNDYSFFKDMAINEQKNILTEIEQINKIISVDKPYRITLLESSIPVEFKASAMKKINMLKYMEPGGGEFYKIKNWIDTFMKIPFGQYKSLPVSRDDGVEKCHGFMENAKNIGGARGLDHHSLYCSKGPKAYLYQDHTSEIVMGVHITGHSESQCLCWYLVI